MQNIQELFVTHDPISGEALSKHRTLAEAQGVCLEPSTASKQMGWTDKPVIYRYDVRDGKAVNPVRVEADGSPA